MRVHSTRDIPLELLHEFSSNLQPDIEVEVDESQTVLLSADPPSWITFFAQADWWIKTLAACGALYVAEIMKEAGKATWKGLMNLASAQKNNELNRLETELETLKAQLQKNTKLIIGLPIPNDYFGTRLELHGASSGKLVSQIAMFIYHLPELCKLIDSEGLTEDTVATGIFLKLGADGELKVSWHDQQTLEKRTKVIPFHHEA